MKKVRGAYLSVGKFIDDLFFFFDEHKTQTRWAIFALLPAGIGLLALSVRLNSTSGWFFWPAIIMIIAGFVVGMDFMAETQIGRLRRGQERRYERSKRRYPNSW